MAETERPHRSSSINSSSNNGSSTDLFICFTSRFSSSSSMRLSSKSIHSPARSACLTTSLSRRLRTSGSLKNASAGVLNSPMFGANGGRKRSGSGYENSNNNNNIEPSSPKVTCIGQVRVKTRKHVKKKMRARSRRKGGESSFRRSVDQNDGGGGGGGGGCRFDASENRWVHLPVTICESLRSFGSELNCFFPCRSSCTENSHGDGRRVESNNDGCSGGGGGSSCGAVFTRWFVAVEETSGGKRREIELVVGGEDEVEEDRRRRSRRHVFEGLDLSEIEMKTEKKERGGEEVGRMSICSPPKNALLLMRCRSDPVKVAALANRVRERQLSLNDGVYGGGTEEEDDERRRRFELEIEDKKRIDLCEKWISGETNVETEEVSVTVAEAEVEVPLPSNPATEEEERVKAVEDSIVEEEQEEEASKILDSFEEEIEATIMKNIEDEIRNAIEEDEKLAEMEDLAAVAVAVAETEEDEESKEVTVAACITQNEERSEQGNREPDPSPEVVMRRSLQEETTEKEKATPYKVLPDCLLLMMCEPKLSMEVSKETWVCSTDFVRCLPGRPPAKKIPPEATGDNHHHHHQPKKRIVTAVDSNASSRRRSIDKPPLHLQPPRSSCSYPAAPPIIMAAAAVGEQKVAGANKAYEPPVLPRCKSEPRKSASKLAPEACFWKNRKLEPHPPASVGVGAAGVGF
ncbi:hypothetical protein ISN45_Aa03g016000 [Arabidopsis thaliana x Arabidopsis arenosa]|uniref:Uncharacterized protein n=1 Tax=Arabidopsis thaliana x Arabidopsis arenosa TaxID=1240361 RepID=A0A8T2ASZ5_9BRAS|nr:hypothetical protein ISN45_Aa03g016000 [Arabidopsis thaliana x Arabidopsis arenosa]